MKALGDRDPRQGYGACIEHEGSHEGLVNAGELAEVGCKNLEHLRRDKWALEGAIAALIAHGGAGARCERVLAEHLAHGFGHGVRTVLRECPLPVLYLKRVVVVHVLPAGGHVLVPAVVGVPAEYVPEFRPRKGVLTPGREHLGGEEPRGHVAPVGAVLERDGLGCHRSLLDQELLDAGNALAGGAHVAALLAVAAPGDGECAISLECDHAGPQNIVVRVLGAGENRPSNGAMARVESDLERRQAL